MESEDGIRVYFMLLKVKRGHVLSIEAEKKGAELWALKDTQNRGFFFLEKKKKKKKLEMVRLHYRVIKKIKKHDRTTIFLKNNINLHIFPFL